MLVCPDGLRMAKSAEYGPCLDNKLIVIET